MFTPRINPHNNTTNPYTQRQILRENLKRLDQFIGTFKISDMKNQELREVFHDRKKQLAHLTHVEKIIQMRENDCAFFVPIDRRN